MESKIADKIKKLMALSNSPNEHEAALATERARALLEKHNLTMTDVELETAEMIKHRTQIPRGPNGEWGYYKKLKRWQYNLCHTINHYFYVQTLFGIKGHIVIVGAKDDVEVANYVLMYLMRAVEKLTRDYTDAKRKEGASGRSYIDAVSKSFAKSCVYGINNTLSKEQRKTKATTANGTELMVVKSSVLKKYIAKEFKLRSLSHSERSDGHSGATEDGYKAGKDIAVRRGVSSTDGKSQKQINL